MQYRTKMLRLLDTPCNIIIYPTQWQQAQCFVSCKDKTPKEFQSSIVYKFWCLGCSKSYVAIGKTDRCLSCLHTRLRNEHPTIDKSDWFTLNTSTLLTSIDNSDTNERFDLTLFLLHNSIILDKAKHWSVTQCYYSKKHSLFTGRDRNSTMASKRPERWEPIGFLQADIN
jgi:hypothetical protein